MRVYIMPTHIRTVAGGDPAAGSVYFVKSVFRV